ncbi:STAS domain-containing protein [Rhodococcus sp. IEGM 1307]|uniref:STAS domain-containing protein n=1 Tax=Rhodococcus sp. IEGM 1307 TaxID=3047091 RepID=UPI0024B83A79|nr:STAS domain-containing protein [Rhodococcus sp. IEGM 1307]MDI9973786.1 STAS domain-containing protein [Rhodococcus sp. IEGM 1307]
MANFRTIFDSPGLTRSSLSGTDLCSNADHGFRIDIDEPTGGPGVLRVRGDVDVVTAPVLSACLAEAVLTGHSVVVDLLRVPFVGCAGLAALDYAATRLSEQRCRLTVAAPAGLHAVLDRIGLSTAAPCFDTVAEAFHAALAYSASTADHTPTFPVLDRSRSLHCSLATLPSPTALNRKGIAR